ncbi:MAG: hypothetical protein ACK5CQ_08145, partial [Cyanobacteriota bacterium]
CRLGAARQERPAKPQARSRPRRCAAMVHRTARLVSRRFLPGHATGNTLPSHGRHQVEERPRANLLLPAAPRPLR